MIKRAFDITMAGIALILLMPLLVVIALVIKIESRGPALFRQQRVGQGGKAFTINKFRTMRLHTTGLTISTSSDARVTRFGRLLRKTKVDELPQLLNVLGGTMSLVGPRPELPKYVALWPPDRRDLILSVRPGITDPASVALRNESELLERATDPERFYIEELLPRKTAMYVEYVHTRSLMEDLKIMMRTAAKVVGNS